MSELQRIAGRLRALAQDASPLSANIASSERQLKSLSDQVQALGRSGVRTGPLLAAIQQARTQTQKSADAADRVRADGIAWADHLASGALVKRESGSPGTRAAFRDEDSGGTGEATAMSIQEIQGWLTDVNPGYNGDPHDPRSNNCGQCAAAVFSRLSGLGSFVAGDWTLSTPEMEAWTGRRQDEMSPGEIERALRNKGPGAHAVIGVDRSEGPGHWFNAYFDGNRVVAIDGQTGVIAPWPPDYGNVILWDAGIGE